MPADANFRDQSTSVKRTLDATNDMYKNVFLRQGSTGSPGDQVSELQNSVLSLKAKLASVQQVADTYDREYMDRIADKPLGGFWRTHGVSTLQDWVLLIFFFLYGIISLALIIIVVFNTRTPVVTGFMVFGASFSMGIMITAVIVRFA